MRTVYLAQVQSSHVASDNDAPVLALGATAPHAYWIPYSIGSIWAYSNSLEKLRSSFRLGSYIILREPIAQIARRLHDPDIVAFSTYVWNEQYHLALAKSVKAKWPSALVVFGGPQIPQAAPAPYLLRNPYIDLLVFGEGEFAFSEILHQRLTASPDYSSIKGCISRDTFAIAPTPATELTILERRMRLHTADYESLAASTSRIRNLEVLPSPYESGVFESLFEQYPQARWNAVLETTRGCPYACNFCDWGALTHSTVSAFSMTRVDQDLQWMARRRIEYVVFADANFGILGQRDQMVAEAMVRTKRQYGFPHQVSLTFAKSTTTKTVAIAKCLRACGLLRALTVSVQSLNPETLNAISRDNIPFEHYRNLIALCTTESIPTYTEVILGLPKETYQSWKTGLTTLLELGQHSGLEAYCLTLLENTPFSRPDVIALHGLNSAVIAGFDGRSRSCDRTATATEMYKVVYETSTMPRDDLLRSLGFLMIIQNLHCYGWTEIISRALRQLGIGYAEFYGKLELWLQGSKSTLLRDEYTRTMHVFASLIGGIQHREDTVWGMDLATIHPSLRSQARLHLNRNKTLDEISTFVINTFGTEVGEQTLAELLLYQRHYVVDPEMHYPHRFATKLDVRLLVNEGRLNRERQVYVVLLRHPYADRHEFIGRLYTEYRQGFCKAVVLKGAEVSKEVLSKFGFCSVWRPLRPKCNLTRGK